MKILESIKNSEILNPNYIPVIKKRVAINGFGRIGRSFLKMSINNPYFDVVALNDLGDIYNMVYLLKHDTVYKSFNFDVDVKDASDGDKYINIRNITDENGKKIEDKKIKFVSQKDASLLPWKELNIDIVIESTGLFTSYDKANIHILSGAKRVIISAPAKPGEDLNIEGFTVLMGINEDKLSMCNITSNASCTTNASSPLISILDSALGIEKAMLNTVHAYTASQSIVDGPNKKDYREGRAASQNIVPSSTGAAIAVAKVFDNIEGKFDGISMRVPVASGSIVDITFISKKDTTASEVNTILKEAAKNEKWQNIFSVTEEDLVSSDIQGNTYASIADLKMTRVVDGNLVKVLAWYDNEVGYTNTLIMHTEKVCKII